MMQEGGHKGRHGGHDVRRRARHVDAGKLGMIVARDMIETMAGANGIGLAGPQIGRDQRIIVVSPTGEPEDATVHVNPRIVEASKAEISAGR